MNCGSSAGASVGQLPLLERRIDDVSEMRGMLKKIMVEDAGGVLAFAEKLDVPASAISRSFAGVDTHEVNLRHIAALLDEPTFAAMFVRWLCLRTGHEPPVKRRRERTLEEKFAAIVKAAKKSGKAGAAVIADAADDLDIEPEAF